MDLKGFFGRDTAGLPNWAWVIVVVGGIAAAYLVPRFLGKGGSVTDTTPTSGSAGTSGIGLAIDPTTGLPYAVEGLVPSGAGTPPPLVGGTTTTSYTGVIRPIQKTGKAAQYDAKNPDGVPIHATPGGNEVGKAAYGSQIKITGQPVNGPNNFGTGDTAGSTLWFPILFNGQAAYVSAYDIASTQAGGATLLSPQEFYTQWPGSNTRQIRLVG